MIATLKLENEDEAVALGNKLISAGLIQHVSSPAKPFKNSPSSLYRIVEKGSASPKDGKGKYPDPPILPRGGIKNITFADVDPLEIARQLYVFLCSCLN